MKHSSGFHICDWCGSDYSKRDSDSAMPSAFCSLVCELRAERSNQGDDRFANERDEWRHQAAGQQRLK